MNAHLVDEVAKVIDPQAFSDWQSRLDYSILKGDDLREAVAYADWISGLEPIRAKAKEIIEKLDVRSALTIDREQVGPEMLLSFGA